MITQYWAVTVYVFVTLVLLLFMVGLASLLGGRAWGHAKTVPYESGIVGSGDAHIRFSVKFYLVAMLFVIFDLEALYLYGWAVSLREVGWQGWIGAAIFIVILLIGLIYDVQMGALDWAPKSRGYAMRKESF